MANGRRHQRWLLIRLAAQNVGSRRMRALFLGIAVMIGVGIAFASFVAGWALRAGIDVSFSRMGADLVIVPPTTLVNITSTLLTVQPTEQTLAIDLGPQLAGIPGIARVAPQRVVPALVEGRRINLIAFDPTKDFSVQTWLAERQPGPVAGIIPGARQIAQLGSQVSVCGMPLTVYGRLGMTGVGPFDESYFLSFEALADVASFCRTSAALGRPALTARDGTLLPVSDTDHADLCSPNLKLDRVSAFLLQLSPGTKLEQVKFRLAHLSSIKIVEGNTALTSSRQALSTLLLGVAVFTALQLTALLILVALVFSAIVQERYRELGLLRAMGANPSQLMTMILAEAVIITGVGGLGGLAFGVAVLLMFGRSLGYYFGILGVPFSWPPLPVLQAGAITAIAFSAFLGLAGALVPAWRARRMAPYALIQAEAH